MEQENPFPDKLDIVIHYTKSFSMIFCTLYVDSDNMGSFEIKEINWPEFMMRMNLARIKFNKTNG